MTDANRNRANDRIVLLQKYFSNAEASIVCGMLVANGIDAFVEHETINSVFQLGFTNPRLMVWKSQYDEALKLIENHGDD